MEDRFTDPARQEVWRTLRELNDAWTKGHPERLTEFFHPRMIAVTPSDRRPRCGVDECLAGWQGFVDATTIHRWREIDPRIEIHGDAAVVAYEYEIEFDMAGRNITQGGRDLFFFVRENGRWWAVADQFSGFPS